MKKKIVSENPQVKTIVMLVVPGSNDESILEKMHHKNVYYV